MINNSLTFLSLTNSLDKKKYFNKNINFTILFYLSKKVKNHSDFIVNRNQKVDFRKNKFLKLLNSYYVKHKPIAHIVKHIYFLNNLIIVDKKVHYPRNETSLLVEQMLKVMKQHPSLKTVLDLCCGTGCIGLSVKKAFPKIDLTMLDVDSRAINNTNKNIKGLKLSVEVIKSDCLTYISKPAKKYSVIFMNPPYVEKTLVSKTLKKYENKISFNNSIDPLRFYKTLFENIQTITTKHFLVGVEFGYNQKIKLISILKNTGLLLFTKFYKDLDNNDRFLIIYK